MFIPVEVTINALRRQVTDAATEYPVTLDEAKSHLRVTNTADDFYINALITAATNELELICWRQFISSDQRSYFPVPTSVKQGIIRDCVLRLELNGAPVTAVSAVKYYDENGTLQTLSGSKYITELDLEPAIITITDIPSFDPNRATPLYVNFTGGWADAASVPQAIKQAILIRIGTLYEQRQEINVGSSVSEIPMTCMRLLTNYRLYKPQ